TRATATSPARRCPSSPPPDSASIRRCCRVRGDGGPARAYRGLSTRGELKLNPSGGLFTTALPVRAPYAASDVRVMAPLSPETPVDVSNFRDANAFNVKDCCAIRVPAAVQKYIVPEMTSAPAFCNRSTVHRL